MPDRAAILLSVHPKWARKILPLAPGTEPVGDEGTKTVETRRVTPVRLGPGSAVVWYETGRGIVGEAEVERIQTDVEAWREHRQRFQGLAGWAWGDRAGESIDDSLERWRNASSPCAIWLKGAREYPRTVALRDGVLRAGIDDPHDPFAELVLRPPQSFRYLTADELAAIRREAGD